MLIKILNALISVVSFVINFIISALPVSPFSWSFDLPSWASWIGVFVPFGSMVTVFGVYLIAVATWYLYSVALRWIKVVK